MAIESKLSYDIKMLIIEYLKTDNDELIKQLREKNMPVDKDKLVRMVSAMDLKLNYKKTRKDIFRKELVRRHLGSYISEVNNPSQYDKIEESKEQKIEDEECNIDNKIPSNSMVKPNAQNEKVVSGTIPKKGSLNTKNDKREKFYMPCKQCGKLLEVEKIKGVKTISVRCEECSKNPLPDHSSDNESPGCLQHFLSGAMIIAGIIFVILGISFPPALVAGLCFFVIPTLFGEKRM